ncbi:MAG: acyl-CoA dehydrogenase family protein [Candidatus Heimdallarchaeota archaeon]
MFDFLLTEQERRLKKEIREFVRNEVSPDLVKDMDAGKIEYPREFVRKAAEMNLLGLRFTSEVGGRNLPWSAEVVAIEEVGVLGSALACLYVLPSIVGEAIHLYGTEEQKQKYLRPIIEGKKFCSEALTEPRGGSDFFGATTTAVKDGDYYILNGQKRFIVGAEGADIFLVYVKTDQTAHPHKSLSVFVVEREMGVQVKKVYGLMGSRGGGTGRLLFKNVQVPEENLVGDLNAGGAIFNQMMVPERMTSAAGALGTARAALEVAAKYSTKRKAFGEHIQRFQGVSFKIADSVCQLDAARSLVYSAARLIDTGIDSRRVVSEAKKFATEMCWEVVNHSMQIMGGIGYTNVYPVERLLRDSRLMMIWTGTNEIMNLLIQHEYYKELLETTEKPRDIEQDALGLDDEEKVYE